MLRVIWVDDDKVTLSISSIALGKAGVMEGAWFLESAQEALQLVEDLAEVDFTDPVLIFLDLNMPVVDGWEFLEVFQKKFAPRLPGWKIYVTSSSPDPEDERRALNSPSVAGYIKKPIQVNFLSELILSFFSSQA